jgi:hypothetical protein
MKGMTTTLAAAGIVMVGATAVSAAPFTYAETFSADGGTGYDLSPFTAHVGTWEVVGGSLRNNAAQPSPYATVDIPGVTTAVGDSVTVSTNFRVLNNIEGVTRIGFEMFSNVAATYQFGVTTYLDEPSGSFVSAADVRFNPEFRSIPNLGRSGEFTTFQQPDETSLQTGSSYLLSATITITSETTYLLSLALSDGTLTETFDFPTQGNLSTLVGTRFGLYTRSNGAQNRVPVVAFDDFTVAFIPEPASLALLAAGGTLLIGRRRHRN